MKKIFTVLIVFLISLSLCACQSADERELERLRRNVNTASANYEQAKQNTKDFQSAMDSYQKAVDALK